MFKNPDKSTNIDAKAQSSTGRAIRKS